MGSACDHSHERTRVTTGLWENSGSLQSPSGFELQRKARPAIASCRTQMCHQGLDIVSRRLARSSSSFRAHSTVATGPWSAKENSWYSNSLLDLVTNEYLQTSRAEQRVRREFEWREFPADQTSKNPGSALRSGLLQLTLHTTIGAAKENSKCSA